jgi:hypothetical protein
MKTIARVLLAVVFSAGCVGSAGAQDAKPTIFVGPLVRDGFLDIDVGIRDSIHDLQEELRLRRAFALMPSRDDGATLELIVIARGIVTNGSVGFSSASLSGGVGSGLGIVVPNTVPTLTTVLRVGAYERAMQSTSGTWRAAAKVAIDDVAAWWEANREAVRALK